MILRRPVGTGTSQQFITVACRAEITALRDDQISAGITQSELNFIISPTQINKAKWPGGAAHQTPPFNVDQRIPRATSDQFIARGKVRTITFVDPKFIDGELVRIDGRMTG